MGVDTVFHTQSFFLYSEKDVEDASVRLTEKYHEEQESYQDPQSFGPEDWSFMPCLDDNQVELIVNSEHRGSATDFIPNLLVALKVAQSMGFSPVCHSISYEIFCGDSVSGIMRIDEECGVSLVEVDSVSGRVVRYLYSLSDIEKIKNRTFDPSERKYMTVLVDGD